MKKIGAVVIAIAIMLVGCGVPEGFEEQSYKISKKVLEVMDAYNEGDLSKDDAKKSLEEYSDRLQDIDERHRKTCKDDSDHWKILGIEVDIRAFQMAIDSLFSKNIEEDSYEIADSVRKKLEL